MAKVPEQILPKPKPRRVPRKPDTLSNEEWLAQRPKEISVREWLRMKPLEVKEQVETVRGILSQDLPPLPEPRSYAFDRDEIREAIRGFPGVEQRDIQRYSGARVDTSYVDELFTNPTNRELIQRQIERGLSQGGDTFYPSYYPLKRALDEQYGPQTYRQFAAIGSAASARNKVANENAIATTLMGAIREGLPLDAALRSDFNQRYKRLTGDNRGLSMTGGHIRNAQKLLNYVEDPVANPAGIDDAMKTVGFLENKLGNLRPYVLDVHEAYGNTLASPYHRYFANQGGAGKTEYGPFERGQQAIADEMGLPPAIAQAGRWLGGRDVTGVHTPPGDFLDNLEKQAAYTLTRRGEKVTPESVREYILKATSGEGPPLMSYYEETPMPDYRQRGEADVGALAGIGGAGAAAAGALYSGDADAASARFVSQLVETLKGAPKKQKWSADELERYLKNNGVKQQELDYFKRQGVIGPDSAFQTDNKLSTNEWLEFFDKMQAQPEVRRFGQPSPSSEEISARVQDYNDNTLSMLNAWGSANAPSRSGEIGLLRGPDGRVVVEQPGVPFSRQMMDLWGIDDLTEIEARMRQLPPMSMEDMREQIGELWEPMQEHWRSQAASVLGAIKGDTSRYRGFGLHTPFGTNYQEVAIGAPWATPDRPPYTASHFGDAPNVAYHYRTQQRPDSIFLEEAQSDLFQKRKPWMFDNWDGDRTKLYSEMLRQVDAATREWKTAMDAYRLKWPRGEPTSPEQAADLKAVNAISDNLTDLQFEAKRLGGIIDGLQRGDQSQLLPGSIPWRTNWPEKAFQNVVSDAVERGLENIDWTPGWLQNVRNMDLDKTGYRTIYDQQLPQVANDFVRRFGGEVVPPPRDGIAELEQWLDQQVAGVTDPQMQQVAKDVLRREALAGSRRGELLAPQETDRWRMTISPQLAERAKKGWPTFAGVPLPLMGDNPLGDPMARLGERDRSFDLTEDEVRGALFEGGPFTNPEVSPDDAAALAMGAAGIANSPYAAGKDMGLKEPAAGFVAGLASFVPDLLTGLSEEAAFAARNREALDAYLAGTGDLPFADRSEIPELPNVYEELMKAMGVDPMDPAAFGGALLAPATPLAFAGPLAQGARKAAEFAKGARRALPGYVDYLRGGPHPGMTPGEIVATSEYIPGFKTGHMAEGGKAMADQPEGWRQLYTMFQQPNVGQADPFYEALGYGQRPWEKGKGRYVNSAEQVEKNPLIVTRLEGEPGKMTAKEREDTSIVERARGLLTAQEASAAHKLTPVPQSQANAVSVQASLPGYADPAYVEKVRDRADAKGIDWVDRGDGRFTFPQSFDGSLNPSGARGAAWSGALSSDAYQQVSARPALFESTYEEIPWGPQGTGQATESLLSAIEGSSSPERFWQMLESPGVRAEAGKWARNDDVIASSLPLSPRDDLQRLRRLVSTGTLRDYVAKFGTAGLHALAGLGFGLGALRQEEPVPAL